MTHNEKGVKGFKTLPKEIKKSKRGVFYLSENQMKRLRDYCNKIGISLSELIRERLNDVI